MNRLIAFIHNIATYGWSGLLRVFLIALMAAVLFPIVTVIAGLDDYTAVKVANSSGQLTSLGNDYTAVKVLLILVALGPLAWFLMQYRRTGGLPLSQWWQCAIPMMIGTVVILLLGIFETTRSLGVMLGLLVDSIAVLIIGAYAFSTRLIYAITVEAPTSAEVDVADAEIPTKAMFRTILSILVWEWFIAWYLIAFNAQLNMKTALFAFVSLIIITLTSYSLGLKGELGQKILMYGAITVFVGVSIVMVDRLLTKTEFTDFMTSGYIGSQLKDAGKPQQATPPPQVADPPMSQSTGKSAPTKMGVFGWMFILLLIVVLGKVGAQLSGKPDVCRISVAIALLLALYLVGASIASEISSWEGPFLFNLWETAKGVVKPTAAAGSPQASIHVMRIWYWIFGVLGEGALLYSGMRRRINPRNRRAYLPRKLPFWQMVNFLLALLLFDWFWWQTGTINQICTDVRRIVGFSSDFCKSFSQP